MFFQETVLQRIILCVLPSPFIRQGIMIWWEYRRGKAISSERFISILLLASTWIASPATDVKFVFLKYKYLASYLWQDFLLLVSFLLTFGDLRFLYQARNGSLFWNPYLWPLLIKRTWKTADIKNIKGKNWEKLRQGKNNHSPSQNPKMAPQDLEEGKYFFGDELVFKKHKE